MNLVLVRKLFRDVRWGLLLTALLLGAFQFLYGKVAQQTLILIEKLGPSFQFFREVFLRTDSGNLIQKIIGGEAIDVTNPMHTLTVGYVHPLVQTILCIWAIGRAAGAIAGELDRGTLELLLAQPVPRSRVIGSHFVVELVTIPVLCLSMWAGTWLGAWNFNLLDWVGPTGERVEPWRIGPALAYVAALVFAVCGYTLLISACGRFRTRVLGLAVLATLLQFMVNLVGQLWDVVAPLRPFTVFYYFQPQQLILGGANAAGQTALNLGVLVGVGLAGYTLALVVFCRRDLPAPL